MSGAVGCEVYSDGRGDENATYSGRLGNLLNGPCRRIRTYSAISSSDKLVFIANFAEALR